MSSTKDHLSYVKTAFKLSGYFPTHKSFHTPIVKLFLTPVMSILCIFIIYNFRYMNNDIFEIAAVFESLSTHGHVFGRKLAILKHASLLEQIITDRRYFWKYDIFGDKLETSFSQKLSFRNLVIKSLSAMCVVMLAYFFLTPMFAKNVEIPQACWIPGNTTFPTILIYTLQMICLSESIPVAIIMDGTFLLMCGEMEIQFTLLKKMILSVKIGENESSEHEELCFQKLKMCTAYHSFLLKEHAKMRKVFSEFFLLQFLLSVEGLCIEIFVANEAKTWSQFALAVIYIVAILMQSSFTFLSASNFETEAEALVDVVYGVDWYNVKNAKISKHIIFMLMKAQKPLRLTGSGFFDVDRNILLQIIRTGFSISALIRQI